MAVRNNRSTKQKKVYAEGRGVFVGSTRSYGGHKVKKRAFKDLYNPKTIYILGGEPTYIHSSDVYWQAGLQTAETTFRKHLYKLGNEQRMKMRQKISYIDEQWKKNLEIVGMNWEEFRNAYKKSYNEFGAENQPEYWEALIGLRDAKTALTIQEALESKKTGSVQQTRSNFETMGFQVADGDIRGEKTARRYADSSVVKKIDRAVDEGLKKVYHSPLFKDMTQGQIAALEKALGYQPTTNTKATKLAAVIGLLQEAVESKVFEVGSTETKAILDAIQKANTNETFDEFVDSIIRGNNNPLQTILISGEGGHRGEEYSKLDNKVNKADSFDILNLSGKQIHFFSTMKTGQIYNWSRKYAANKPTPVMNRFNATLETSSLNFQDSADQSPIHKGQADKVQALMNYVYRNAAAGASSKDIEHFRDMTVSYLGWLKLLTEIVGNPSNDFMIPIALKMFDEIYNTADIIRLFVDMDDMDLFKKNYINKTNLKDFYTWKYASGTTESQGTKKKIFDPNGQGQELYFIKSVMLRHQKTPSYRSLYNAIKSYLNTLAVAKLQLPSIKTYLNINIKNIERRLEF